MTNIEDLEARIIVRVYNSAYSHAENILHLLKERTLEVGHDQAVMDIWRTLEEEA